MAAEWQKPPDWLDEERMNFLSAPLPSQRTDKPSQWDTQTKFWSDLIVSSCSDCCQVSILGRHVEERFTRSGRTPACLAGVVEDACKQGVLRSAKSWEKNDCSESWLEWGVNLASSWLTGSPERPESWLEVTYVIPKLVEQFSSDVISEHSRRASSSGRNDLFSPEGFVSLCRHVRPSLSKDDVGLLSRWLEKSSKLSIYLDEIDNEMIKLAVNGERPVSPPSKPEIALYRLRLCCVALSKQIEEVMSDIKRCTEAAKQKQMLGMRDGALSLLRRRKRLLKSLTQKEGTAENIEQLITGLRAVHDDRKIIGAMEVGVQAYREAMADINIDKVADTMDEFRDLHDKHNEVNAELCDSFSVFITDDGSMDMSELEAELDSLIHEDGIADAHAPSEPPVAGASAATPQKRDQNATEELCIPVTPPESASKPNRDEGCPQHHDVTTTPGSAHVAPKPTRSPAS
eukprot:scpid63502/ scgid28078/ Charged multivesicular body protein 7; Chromatin-modifying protein 7